jgi:hypothetical protein
MVPGIVGLLESMARLKTTRMSGGEQGVLGASSFRPTAVSPTANGLTMPLQALRVHSIQKSVATK